MKKSAIISGTAQYNKKTWLDDLCDGVARGSAGFPLEFLWQEKRGRLEGEMQNKESRKREICSRVEKLSKRKK